VLTFGVIAEGPTDQTVIENILLGYFQDEEEEPDIHFVQPPRHLTETPAGWGHVFKSLERKYYEGALQYNDYLVIHIDTDVQEDPGFDVPRREGGSELSLPDRVARVIARLRKDIDATFYKANEHRFLFAVAVDTIECWLLPLLYGDKRKAAKTTGCLESANQSLRKADEDALSAGVNKFIRAYEKASRDYRKRKMLMNLRNKNPSLELFIKQLDALRSRLTSNQSAASQGRGDAAPKGEKAPGNTASDQPE
jgi:hypothetical protein